MNEKIKEIIVKSNIDIRGHYDESGNTPQQLQEFAELIVQECMQIIKVDMYEDAISNMWSKNKLQMIKEHFGVEE